MNQFRKNLMKQQKERLEKERLEKERLEKEKLPKLTEEEQKTKNELFLKMLNKL